MTTRPPSRRIITDFSHEHKSHIEQLRAMADDLLKQMRANLNDPKAFKTYAESFSIVSKLLDGGVLPTEQVTNDKPDISGFE